MATTTKKKPAKKAKPSPKLERPVERMPDTFMPITERDNAALADTMERETMFAHGVFSSGAATAALAALTDEEYQHVAEWVRAFVWMMQRVSNGVTRRQITTPSFVTSILASDLVSVEIMLEKIVIDPSQLLEELPAAADVPKTLLAAPDGFLPLPVPRDDALLQEKLRVIVAFKVQGDEAIVKSLTDEQYALTWAWMREVDYICTPTTSDTELLSAHEVLLRVPSFLTHLVDDQLATVEAMLDNGILTQEQLVREAPTMAETVVDAATPVLRDSVSEHGNAPATPIVPAVPEANGQLPLVKEPVKPTKPIKGVAFNSPEEVASVRLALAGRQDDLEAEAKRLSALGRSAEGAALLREAKNIKEMLLPQVTAQTAMAFNEAESLPSAIARVFAGNIRYKVRTALSKNVSMKKGESRADAEQRQLAKLDDMEALIGNIGEQAGALAVALVTEAADRGFQKGAMASTATPSSIAREAVQAVDLQKLA
ncbi:MAG: hypothetical protein V4617_14980 [Gemmatimonadota bacterium]